MLSVGDLLDFLLDLLGDCVLDGAGRAVCYFVDVFEGENVADAGSAGGKEHGGGAFEAEEELVMSVRRYFDRCEGVLTLSPQMDRRNHVLSVWYTLAKVLHVAVSLMTLKNLTFCAREPKPRSGTWKRRLDDLKRNGSGGVADAVYATTLLGWAT